MELFKSSNTKQWQASLSSYSTSLDLLSKPSLLPLDAFYVTTLPSLLRSRDPTPFLTKPDLHSLMQWKLSRGKHRPRLLAFVESLDDSAVEAASRAAFAALPDLKRAVTEMTVLKGVGPATASAVLAAYAPEVAPFMSDEAMVAALGSAKEYTLKQYLLFAERLKEKAEELSKEGEIFTPSDVERALWSYTIAAKMKSSSSEDGSNASTGKKNVKRKR